MDVALVGACWVLSPQSPFFWHGMRLVIEEWKLGNMENWKHGFYMIRLKVCWIMWPDEDLILCVLCLHGYFEEEEEEERKERQEVKSAFLK